MRIEIITATIKSKASRAVQQHIPASCTTAIRGSERGAEIIPLFPCFDKRSMPPFEYSSPLGGSVGVQHAAPLHPAPDSVHASKRLLLQAAAASLDALLDPKH